IRRRIASLEEQLKELEKKRGMLRERRKKNGVITAAIVGYTNAGKSTLLNRLTGAGVLAKDMLFATLDLTSRGIELPDGRTVILVDTVGFIRRLPHQLIEAFKSTLEEAKNSDLIINVCDASSPELLNELEVTTNLLNELGAGETRRITVLNKCDIVEEVPRLTGEQYGKVVEISAISGEGIEKLLCEISRELEPSQVRMKLKIPYSDAGITAKIREEGKVFSEEYLPDGIEADVLVDKKILYLAEKYRKIKN
ncbi:MAG: GTPase HflX, partial [Oscillospiraceae bacterium]|nr:GTPase HflX [Oscillospiraceae bacterium]